MFRDAQGNPMTGATAAAAALYDRAVTELQCYVGDPFATLDAALREAPGFVMAHAFRGQAFLLGTDAPGLAEARASLERARDLPASDRERLHLASIRAGLEGDFAAARERLEDVLLSHPRDALALQAAHVWDFFLGDARSLRDRVARARRAWDPAVPGWHAVLGMHAFGLEECGDYARAEALGREAVALEPRDGWAQHAVAHVMEMQGRAEEGIAWMRGNEAGWAPDSFFAVHNWWHLALYHLESGAAAAALALYDGPIRGGTSGMMLDMIDASALLWRLLLRDADTGGRWGPLAELWAPTVDDGHYAFNDCHAMMAFVGAGRDELAGAILARMARRVGEGGTNAAMTREVGIPVAEAIRAFGRGDWRGAIERLRPVRATAFRFGGSHAQRDVLDLTIAEAAIRAGDAGLAQALAAERRALKPDSPLARLIETRAAAIGPAAASRTA